jgi:hypothetical protein
MTYILVYEKHSLQEMILYFFLYSIKMLHLCDPDITGKNYLHAQKVAGSIPDGVIGIFH